jgi:hypothetical protein
MNLRKIFKRKRKTHQPVVYGRDNKPLQIPPNSERRKAHRYQRPSNFNKNEMKEILEKQSTKNNESE